MTTSRVGTGLTRSDSALSRRDETASVSPWRSRFAQAGILVVVAGAIGAFGWIRKDAAILGEILTFLMAVLLMTRFPTITKLKALGVEVEVEQAIRAKDEAQQAAEDAKATVQQLRSVASTLGRLTLDQLGLSGRLGSAMSLLEKKQFRDDVRTSLAAAGCTDDELATASELLDRTIRFDLAARVLSLAGQLPQAHTDAFQDSFRHMVGVNRHGSRQPGRKFDPIPAEDIRKFLDREMLDDARVLRRLREYEEYERSGLVPDTVGDEVEQQEVRDEATKASVPS